MKEIPVGDLRDIALALSPPAVSQYLAAHDWELEARVQDVKEIWRLPGEDGPVGRIMLPLATDYVDFPRRFRETMQTLATIYDWDPAQLVERIAAARADLFFVRLDQEMIDGTIPFRQAETTLEALFRMMKAAATTADDPTHSHRGRRSATVTEFLEENIRLGHTKRGSFVFTVVSRLGDVMSTETDGMPQVSFPRAAMATLAKGLQSTRTLALQWDDRALERSGELGLSANLVESVWDLTQSPDLRALDLSFDWAAGEPAPTLESSRIVIDRDAMAGLPRVRERLVRSEEPPRYESLLGIVRTLNRDDLGDGGEGATSIVLSTHVDGRSRKVHVPLAGTDYEWAIAAHQSKRPLVVSGNLSFERGAWRLTGDITVDRRLSERSS
ncbi:hypothetical protein SAMN04244553_5338 [Nocardia amikacinitolerans]|uniref:Uncharacterized protein n=1 Tax=Nocardia amikacinitolerans TaxID=756689 RepID=A0A285LXJ5_9NOCA|nr:hypothetical protein [Nocardia amikacinitolerans]SNY88366.1 hypothetical protein SAMN04244553_5338 [Nocardia amikacinitolerans]